MSINTKTTLKLMISALLLFSLLQVKLPVSSTYSQLTDTETGGAVLSAQSWTSPQAAAQQVTRALNQNPADLFNLLDDDLIETFGGGEFQNAFNEAMTTIEGAVIIEPVTQLDDEWAQFTVQISNGTVQNFRVILHQENGEWKMFGTSEVP